MELNFILENYLCASDRTKPTIEIERETAEKIVSTLNQTVIDFVADRFTHANLNEIKGKEQYLKGLIDAVNTLAYVFDEQRLREIKD